MARAEDFLTILTTTPWTTLTSNLMSDVHVLFNGSSLNPDFHTVYTHFPHGIYDYMYPTVYTIVSHSIYPQYIMSDIQWVYTVGHIDILWVYTVEIMSNVPHDISVYNI